MKNLLKRLVALSLCAVFSFSLVACGTEELVGNDKLEKILVEKNVASEVDDEDPDKFGGDVSTIYAQTKQMISASCAVSSIRSKVSDKAHVSKAEASALINDAICFTTDVILYNNINLLTLSDGEIANLVCNVAIILGNIGWLEATEEMDDEEYENVAEDISWFLCYLTEYAKDFYEIVNMVAYVAENMDLNPYFEEDEEDPEEIAEEVYEEYEKEDEEEEDLDDKEEKEEEEEKAPVEEEQKEETPAEEQEEVTPTEEVEEQGEGEQQQETPAEETNPEEEPAA